MNGEIIYLKAEEFLGVGKTLSIQIPIIPSSIELVKVICELHQDYLIKEYKGDMSGDSNRRIFSSEKRIKRITDELEHNFQVLEKHIISNDGK